MEGSDSFGTVSEHIAREFHAALSRFEPTIQSGIKIHEGAVWNQISDNTKALFVTVVKKLMIDEIIIPGPKALIKE